MKIVVLTGAGISAESGVPMFRGNDGLWEGAKIDDVATPEGFARDPERVHQFYNQRRCQLLGKEVRPNPAHLALAKLALTIGDDLTLVTQNIDNLHERGGSPRVLHMHGELLRSRCNHCDDVADCFGDLSCSSLCERCGMMDCLRPHVVWFGEMPYFLDQIMAALDQADMMVSIGTSGTVQPAAGFVLSAKRGGSRTLELNLDASVSSSDFDESRRGPASQLVPKWVDAFISQIGLVKPVSKPEW